MKGLKDMKEIKESIRMMLLSRVHFQKGEQ
mgnify:CR=1 FL=1